MGHLGLTFLKKEETSAGARFGTSHHTKLWVCESNYTLSLHNCYGQNLLQLLTLKLPGFMLLSCVLLSICRHLFETPLPGCRSQRGSSLRSLASLAEMGFSCALSGFCQQMAISVVELQSKTHFCKCQRRGLVVWKKSVCPALICIACLTLGQTRVVLLRPP